MTDNPTRLLWIARLLALSWMGLIFFLSGKSSLPAPLLFPCQDKLVHGLVYAVLGALYWFSLYGRSRRAPWPGLAWVTLLAFLYGLSDEFHQSLVPQRSPEGLDLLADTIGGCLGAVMARLAGSSRQVA